MKKLDLIKKVHGYDIIKKTGKPWQKILYHVTLSSGVKDWFAPKQLNLRSKFNQRQLEAFNNKVLNKRHKNILEDGYSGSGKKNQLTKLSMKKREKKDLMKNQLKSKKKTLIINYPQLKKKELIKSISGYSIIFENNQVGEIENCSNITFTVMLMNNNQTDIHCSNININSSNNIKKINEFIESQQGKEDFQLLSNIKIHNRLVYIESSVQKQLDNLEQAQNECQNQIINWGSPVYNYFSQVSQYSNEQFQKESEETEFINTTTITKHIINEKENQIQDSEQFEQEELEQVQKILFSQEEKKYLLDNISNFQNKRGILFEKLFINEHFHIYRQNPDNKQTLIDILNMYCQQNLILDKESLNKLLLETKNSEFIELEDNESLNNLVLLNYNQIIFNPSMNCFLTPKLKGIIERDQILRYYENKYDISNIILIGKKGPYILQYKYVDEDKLGGAVIRKIDQNYQLFDNSQKEKITLQKQKNILRRWTKNIDKIYIYQMKYEKFEKTYMHYLYLAQWYMEILGQQIPMKFLKEFRNQVKKQ